MKFIGIDLAKSSFVAAFPQDRGYRTTTYKNDKKGIEPFLEQLDKQEHHCVLEATGNYGALLLHMLTEREIPVSMVNPKQTKHFARMMLTVTKTDKIDAQLIALYGEKMHPPLYKMPEKSIQALKQQKTLLSQMKKQRAMSYNLQESFSVLPQVDALALKTLKQNITFIEKRIEILEKQMLSISQEAFNEQYKRITSIKGIGNRIALEIIVATAGGKDFQRAKQFSKYIGIAPSYEHSGSSIRKKGHINRHGDPELRSMLYMASWSAIRFNKACKAFYERLKARGKSSKVALMAVANKLIRQVFAILRDDALYVDGFLSHRTINPSHSSCFLT